MTLEAGGPVAMAVPVAVPVAMGGWLVVRQVNDTPPKLDATILSLIEQIEDLAARVDARGESIAGLREQLEQLQNEPRHNDLCAICERDRFVKSAALALAPSATQCRALEIEIDFAVRWSVSYALELWDELDLQLYGNEKPPREGEEN